MASRPPAPAMRSVRWRERQEWSSRLHGYGLSGIKRRTIAARINSAIQPNIRPRAGLTVTVTKAVAPITQRHDGLPSNRRREIARSVPAKMSSEPTAPDRDQCEQRARVIREGD